MSAGTDGALDALRALAKQGRAADPAAIVAAVAALELSTAVFESLLDEFSAAVQRGPAMGWQRALGAFIGRLSEEQLSSWRWEAADVRWSAAEGATSSPTASLEVRGLLTAGSGMAGSLPRRLPHLCLPAVAACPPLPLPRRWCPGCSTAPAGASMRGSLAQSRVASLPSTWALCFL